MSCAGHISIPYGAIKRRQSRGVCNSTTEISIPYGAIKSRTSLMSAASLSPFQFHMVRLKAKMDCTFIVASANFNSIWCD